MIRETIQYYGHEGRDYKSTPETETLRGYLKELEDAMFDVSTAFMVIARFFKNPPVSDMGIGLQLFVPTVESDYKKYEDLSTAMSDLWDSWVEEHIKDPKYFTDVTEEETE